MYVRCHLPLIIWEKAALAPFIKEKEIGICINSLEELDGKLEKLTVDDYFKMKSRVIEISNLLSVGYFFTKALYEAVKFQTKSDVADEGRN